MRIFCLRHAREPGLRPAFKELGMRSALQVYCHYKVCIIQLKGQFNATSLFYKQKKGLTSFNSVSGSSLYRSTYMLCIWVFEHGHALFFADRRAYGVRVYNPFSFYPSGKLGRYRRPKRPSQLKQPGVLTARFVCLAIALAFLLLAVRAAKKQPMQSRACPYVRVFIGQMKL